MKNVIMAIGLTIMTATMATTQEMTWSSTINGIMKKQCLTCHGTESAQEYSLFKKEKEEWLSRGQGMRMDTYSHLVSFVGWPNTGALMRRLDDGNGTKDGKSGNMYQHLGATEDERQKNLGFFKSWVGKWSLKRLPETSMEDLNSIKVKY